MPRFYGKIGYAEMVEKSPGVWVEELTERNYYGELVRTRSMFQTTDQLNDNLNVSNEISIVADPYANQNFSTMRFVEFMGVRWKITNVEVKPPRLILTVGGVYNGET